MHVQTKKRASAAMLVCLGMMCPPQKLTAKGMQDAYDLALARFYMWAQTDSTVFLVVHIPTGE